MPKDKRELPEKLQQRQEVIRRESIDLVQNAINELKAEGCKVTMTALVERTGLARSTLSKKHIQMVLKSNKVCKYARIKSTDATPKSKVDFELALADAMIKINDLTLENSKLKNTINVLKVQYYELRDDNARLQGELQMLSQKARMHGVRLELLRDEE